jgi:hypothetical protein
MIEEIDELLEQANARATVMMITSDLHPAPPNRNGAGETLSHGLFFFWRRTCAAHAWPAPTSETEIARDQCHRIAELAGKAGHPAPCSLHGNRRNLLTGLLGCVRSDSGDRSRYRRRVDRRSHWPACMMKLLSLSNFRALISVHRE